MNKPEPCDGFTALNRAAKVGNVPVIQLLINKGARIEVKTKKLLSIRLH
jgi:ankyrin repeat protein